MAGIIWSLNFWAFVGLIKILIWSEAIQVVRWEKNDLIWHTNRGYYCFPSAGRCIYVLRSRLFTKIAQRGPLLCSQHAWQSKFEANVTESSCISEPLRLKQWHFLALSFHPVIYPSSIPMLHWSPLSTFFFVHLMKRNKILKQLTKAWKRRQKYGK